MKAVRTEDDLILMTQNGQIMRTSTSDLRAIGRATQGVRLINLRERDKLITVERAVREEDNGGDNGIPQAELAEGMGEPDGPPEPPEEIPENPEKPATPREDDAEGAAGETSEAEEP
jgi:DNA gyrase subunit A